MARDAHSLVSTLACVDRLKAPSSDVLPHGDIHGQHFGDGMARVAREALNKEVPPFQFAPGRGLAVFN
jgi:hypothetical protein